MRIYPLLSAALRCAALSLLTGAVLTGALPAVRAAEVAADFAPCTFTYVAAPGVRSVSVAGTFNNWDKSGSPLKLDPDGKTWRTTISLAYGVHYYKFVLNGETWVTDPKADNKDDGNGNVNSRRIVQPPDYARPARPDDGVLAASALQHRQIPPFLNYDRGKLTLSIRLRPNDARSVTAVVTTVGSTRRYPMQLTAHDELYAHYQTQIPWDRQRDLAYRFEVADGPRTFQYGSSGLADFGTIPFRLSAAKFKPFAVPGWVERGVIYQIFPDRFDNGDHRNDPPDVQPWDAKPTYYNRFGGDIAGVRKHVDYLQSLGVSAVYFNPVFASPSNHRYDTTDYLRIDPQFGTNDQFAALTQELNRHGIRTVMDFVFNHTATNFAAFRDIRDKGEASVYKNWYFIHSYPVQINDHPNYSAWYGFSSMPKLNVMNPETRDYLFGVVDYWRKRVPLAGMRLDVAGEVDPRFWRAMRQHVKSEDPNIWIVGEFWGDGSPWLSGDQWDAVMDYPFREACVGYFAEGKTGPTQFLDRLMSIYGSYAPQVSRNLMNMLSSHDTPRFLTLCNGNGDLDRLAATMQFTWVGSPSIYYGEEIGMRGGADPENRGGMEWKRATTDNPMLRYYRHLIAIRNASPALQSGDPQVLLTDDATNTLAFARVLPAGETSSGDAAIVAINRSTASRTLTIPLRNVLRGTPGLTDALTGKRLAASGNGTISVTLPPLRAAILLPDRR